MNSKILQLGISFSLVSLVMLSCTKKNEDQICAEVGTTTIVTKVFATGLNNPRGIKFGSDNKLYVAEGGTGGTEKTNCIQVIPPVGPYTGSNTGSGISVIDEDGNRTTLINNLPSSMTSKSSGSLVSGVADVSFLNGKLYALLGGAGCSHGVPSHLPNGVVVINGYNDWSMIANLSAFQMSHPVTHPNADDFEPDGSWYSLITANSELYAVEPNHGEVDRINKSGTITRLIDISATQGHIVPTSITFHNGSFYFGNLTTYPLQQGAAKIYKLTTSGQLSVYATGFTNITGLVFDDNHKLYVLESTVGSSFPAPASGKIIRIDTKGSKETISTGLNFPTALTIGPDGGIYVSNWGFGGKAGQGEIIKITFKCELIHGDKAMNN